MSFNYQYGKPNLEKVMRLEVPGKELLFDMDRGLIQAMSKQFDVGALIKSIQSVTEKKALQLLCEFGKDSMEALITLANGTYLDRTGEMIEKVARSTGKSFPHRFQRYVELWLLSLMPQSRRKIITSTTRELRFEISSCPIQNLVQESGVEWKTSCQQLCFAGFNVAMLKVGNSLRIELVKALPQDNICEFCVMPQS